MTTPQEPQLRLFIAIELPESWREALAAVQEQIGAKLAAGGSKAPRLRWTQPEGIHLTLKFLGETPASRREAIEDALAGAIQAVPDPPLALSLGEVGMFGNRQGPRVLWMGVSGQAQRLDYLAGEVDTAMAGLGYAREKRPLRPHLTLARVPEGTSEADRATIGEATRVAAVVATTAFDVECVSLMQSHLGPGGARYEQLATFPRK